MCVYIFLYTLFICFCIGLLVITGAATFSAARYICIEVYCDDTCQEVFSIFRFVNSSEKEKKSSNTHTHIVHGVAKLSCNLSKGDTSSNTGVRHLYNHHHHL